MNEIREEEGISLLDIFYKVKQHLLFIIISIVLCVGAMGVYSISPLNKPQYIATASVILSPNDSGLTPTAGLSYSLNLISTYEEFLCSKVVKEEALKILYDSTDIDITDNENKLLLESMKTEYENKKTGLDSTLSIINNSLNTLKAEYEASISGIDPTDEANKETLRTLEEEYNNAKAELESAKNAVTDSLTRLETEYNEKVSSLISSSIPSFSISTKSNGTLIVYISIKSYDPELSMNLVNAYIVASERIIMSGAENTYKALERALPRPFEEATGTTTSRNLFRNCIIGGAVGVVIACAYVFLRMLIDNTYIKPEELEKDLKVPVLAITSYIDFDKMDEIGVYKKKINLKSILRKE